MSATPQPARVARPQPNSGREVLAGRTAPLDAIFNPTTVAVIGATERPNSVGHKTLSTLLSNQFAGAVFAVNPNRDSVLGVKTYPTICQVPQPVDLAVIVTRAAQVPQVIAQCVEAGVKGAIIISDEFREPGGAELERQVRENLRSSRMRVIGPDCLGILNPITGLNTSFALQMPLGGSVAFLSQSGALCTAVLAWSLKEIVGFSAFVSVGTMLDIDWGDLVDYFGRDTQTRSILIYMESIGNAGSFLSAAREVSLNKPIIVVKAGRNPAAARAVATHTGCDAGCDEVTDAALRRVGVLRVDDITDLFSMADALSKQPQPKGPRLAVVSNALSSSVLAADAVISNGGELAALSDATRHALKRAASSECSNENPIVLLGAGPEAYIESVEIAAREPNCDGVLAVVVPQAMSDPIEAGEMLLGVRKTCGKPVLACFTGFGAGTVAPETLMRACIPTFASPAAAARAFNYMWRYRYNLRGLYETPVPASTANDDVARSLVQNLIHTARDAGNTVLGDTETKRLLATYRIPVTERRLAHSEAEAVRIAIEFGFPVSLRLVPGHTQPELLQTSLRFTALDEKSVRCAWNWMTGGGSNGERLAVSLEALLNTDGYEVAVGSRVDAQFGPVLWFAAGGRFADSSTDRTFALPPLNTTLAYRMMEQTRIFGAVRNAIRHTVTEELAAALVRFSQLVVEQPWIKEIEANPLLVSNQRVVALDARAVLHGPEIGEPQLPRTAIRPYPIQYVNTWTMKDGQTVTFRPIRAEDEPLMIKFHEGLSDQSVYLRYFQQVKLSQRTQHERLTRICFIDYDREMALIAERRDPLTDERRIVALGSLGKVHGCNEAEVAVIISDDYQGRGLGSETIRQLVRVARNESLERVIATTLLENQQMTAILKHLGFQVSVDYESQLVNAELKL